MKKFIGIVTVLFLLISCVSVNVSATDKITVLGRRLAFDVWQGEGEVSVEIEKSFFSSIELKTDSFESLRLNEEDIDNKNYYVTDCDNIILITLKENYLTGFEDGRYFMYAEFNNASVPLCLYVVRQVTKVDDVCYNFTSWLGSGTAEACLRSGNLSVNVWPDLFQSISLDGKAVDKESYYYSAHMDVMTITLKEEYLKSFLPGEYYFSADFVNEKDIQLKLRVFGENAPGDVDGDGNIAASDARLALRASVELDNLSTEEYLAADIDNDSSITASDARTLLRISVGLEKAEQDIIFNSENTTVKEVPIDGNSNISTESSRAPFDLNSILTGDNHKFNIFFFKGKVVDIKAYEVSWTDENNEVWGPFRRNIISVQLDEIYTGNVPVKNKIIRVLSTENLNRANSGSVKINIGEEYVFLNCWVLDDKYFEQITRNSESNQIYDSSLMMSDVVVGGVWNSIFPVANDSVLIYNEYLSDITNITKNTLSSKNSEFDKFVTDKADFKNDYVIVTVSDFEKSIGSLLKNSK